MFHAPGVAGTGGPRTPLLVEFGSRVRDRRLALGWSQEDLALSASINRTYIGSLEAGERNPALGTLCRLARALMLDVGELTAGLQRLEHRR